MSWHNHPRYVPVRDALIKKLAGRHSFGELQPVVFLCGAKKSSARDRLRDYLIRRENPPHVFYAETVWKDISENHSSQDALQMEAKLAGLADLVIIIVESPGTFTELGAFAIHRTLRSKLLPIVDPKFKGDGSFISTGPLSWVEKESKFKPVVYAKHDRILQSAAEEIEKRLSQISGRHRSFVANLNTPKNAKHLLFYVCDLIAIVGPAPTFLIKYYLLNTIPKISESTIINMLGLGVAVNLLECLNKNEQRYYKRIRPDALDKPFQAKSPLQLVSERAKHVEVMQTISEAKSLLHV